MKNFRTKWEHTESKKIFVENGVDVLVFNRLDAQKILHESKESYDGLGMTARKNMVLKRPLGSFFFAQVYTPAR